MEFTNTRNRALLAEEAFALISTDFLILVVEKVRVAGWRIALDSECCTRHGPIRRKKNASWQFLIFTTMSSLPEAASY
jgi:hypothetical protein